ncbi:phosphoglycerol geranylgeranyltransferase [Nafulsella turpanensis]|uniref:geranylgeranylglyceryl/heptaprenylglyceryl phosphate synthase n=1 Tax=Nafulsella turpanensis TaxID=1265690 RepID=UPI00034CB802|nr:geranylgeranylglyceryl/heptaprenylglyceryl phosphate synthase [Nafulsella turpanensis]
MLNNAILSSLASRRTQGIKSFAVLIDPDKITDKAACQKLINMSIENKVDFFFVGGSLVTDDNYHSIVAQIKDNCHIPVILFPGSNMHISMNADAILFLSLISGRNPELLIGQHVVAAPILRKSRLEIIPTGYMLVNSGSPTTVAYMSNTSPIPNNKPSIAACTAMAGEMLGLRLIYMDAGSGSPEPVSPRVINMVRKSVDTPLIVGGGIRSAGMAIDALQAGADVVVVGNGIEKNPNLLIEVSNAVNDLNAALNIH